jgi:hypothetical protein
LQEHSGKNTNHETGNGVRVITKELSCLATSHDLGTRSEKLESKKEKVKEKANQQETKRNVAPLLGSVAAARGADLTPGGVAILLIDIKVVITKVDRVSGTVLTAPGGDNLVVEVFLLPIASLLLGLLADAVLNGLGGISLSFKCRLLGVFAK